MLAARDQENLVYSHQTNAASKPLNHGIQGLQPKTPGQRAPKTPFKPSFHDENNATNFGGQKTGLKALGRGDENRVQPKKKDGKLDSNSFVTPMGRAKLLRDNFSRLKDVCRATHACTFGYEDYQRQRTGISNSGASATDREARKDLEEAIYCAQVYKIENTSCSIRTS
jgi:hypothetical protein